MSFSFSSSNSDVATINSNGLVNAVKKGSTSLTIKSGKRSEKILLYVASRNELSVSVVYDALATNALSSLSYLVNVPSMSVPTSFSAAKTLSDKYVKAVNAVKRCASVGEPVHELNNLIAVPNEALLDRASKVLKHYFKSVNASYSLPSEPKVSVAIEEKAISGDPIIMPQMTGDVTFSKKLSENDVLYYCFSKKQTYSANSEISYEGSYDARVCDYQAVNVASGDPFIRPVSGDGKIVYKGARDLNPSDASGNPVIRHVKQTITLSYIETLGENVSAEASRLEKTYLVDTAHYGSSIVDPSQDYKVVGTIKAGEDVFIQDTVYENYGTREQKNYFTYDIVKVSTPEYTDIESYTYVKSGAVNEANARLTLKGTSGKASILIDPVEYRSSIIKGVLKMDGYQVKI